MQAIFDCPSKQGKKGSFSITIAAAPPPPLHIEAKPFSPVLS
jgi:hypothetical protein